MERTSLFQLSRKQHFQCLLEPRSAIHRNQQCEQCPAVGKRVWQTNALVSPTKPLNRDEPIRESRADVEMGNEEDEEPFEAEIPRVRMNPQNPTTREKQEHGDSGHVVYRSWCAACVESRGVGGQQRIEPLEEEEGERTTPIVAFDYCFLTQGNADTFPLLICRDSKYDQTVATCCERKSPTAYSISFLVGVIKDLGFRRIILKCDNEPSTKALQDALIHACGPCGSDSTRTDHLRVITWPTVVLKWL